MNRRRQRSHCADRGDIENDSLALPDHLFVNRFGDRKQAVDVSMNYFVPGAISCCSEVVAAVDGGVVHENVDPTPLLHQFARQLLHADAVDDGDLRVESLATIGFNLLGHLGGEIVTRVVAKGHIRALAGKNVANRSTDATRSTGDERALSLKQK